MMKGLANVGDVLAGKYRVDKILGIGGMGMVVQAMHLDIDQKVALKFMLPTAMETPEAGARFLREARAAGRLTGEHVCRVIDVGRFASGAPYIVMEYLEGYNLGTLVKRRGPLAIAEAIDYILQACEGMAEAHAVGIVHRDLKPDNLFLATRVDGSRVIKVLDFGISKAAVTGLATKTGDVLGSPAFMAPEQMKSTKDVDARADLWSLGVVLHHLLTGRTPFHHDTLPGLCLAVMQEPAPDVTTIRADVPPPLARAILRCLEKDREARFADVSQLAEAIAPFGSADALGAVTRVRSMLRGRATPQTLPPTADEIADAVPPTLMASGDLGAHVPSSLDTPVMRRPSPPARAAGTTTLASSAGESMELPRRRIPLGVLGAAAGTLGMIVLIVVMVVRRGARDERTPGPVAPAAPAAAAAPTAPVVTPIAEPPPPPPAVVAPAVTEPPSPTTTPEPKPRRVRRAGSAASVPTDGGAPVDAPPADDDDDKWNQMLHDQEGR